MTHSAANERYPYSSLAVGRLDLTAGRAVFDGDSRRPVHVCVHLLFVAHSLHTFLALLLAVLFGCLNVSLVEGFDSLSIRCEDEARPVASRALLTAAEVEPGVVAGLV